MFWFSFKSIAMKHNWLLFRNVFRFWAIKMHSIYKLFVIKIKCCWDLTCELWWEHSMLDLFTLWASYNSITHQRLDPSQDVHCFLLWSRAQQAQSRLRQMKKTILHLGSSETIMSFPRWIPCLTTVTMYNIIPYGQ